MKQGWIVLMMFFTSFVFSQEFNGTWSGLLIKAGNIDEAQIIYVDFTENNGQLSGLSRVEMMKNMEEFAVTSFDGKVNGNKIEFSEDMIRRSSNSRNAPTCMLNASLSYDSSTAYLKGTFQSTDCRHERGEIVLFRSDYEVNTEKKPPATHVWAQRFIRNYKKGYPAPEILKKEQDNFTFQTIYFDYDKARIRPEFVDYLTEMARVLDAIHDLRVKITGHTDSDGSDPYNMVLSEERADAIRDFFKSRGVDVAKLDIDFKGKRKPAATNNTREGRQKNRRVVFEFAYGNE